MAPWQGRAGSWRMALGACTGSRWRWRAGSVIRLRVRRVALGERLGAERYLQGAEARPRRGGRGCVMGKQHAISVD